VGPGGNKKNDAPSMQRARKLLGNHGTASIRSVTGKQRRGERHRLRFKLVYDDGETFNAGAVSDVSESGIFLETALPLRIGTEVQLTPLDQAGDHLFEVKARVVRSVAYDNTTMDQAGMGLEFVDLTDEDRKNVSGLIMELKERKANFRGVPDPYLGVFLKDTDIDSSEDA
jgi:hypothetical protein